MKELILSYLGENPHPILVEAIDQILKLTNQIDEFTNRYPKWELVLVTFLITFLYCKFSYFIYDLDVSLFKYIKRKFFSLVKKIPFLNKEIMKEINKSRVSLEEEIMKSNKGNLFVQKLPDKGIKQDDLLRKIEDYMKMNDLPWENGAVSGCVYGADQSLTELTTRVYEKFAWTNPMHADVFPNVRKMEAEVVRMTLNLFHGDQDSCGTMTTGGTESIMLACKAYRDLAYERGIDRPEMVVPVTAHAAFDKAANFFRIKINHVPVDPVTKKVNPNKLKSYINSNTCMIVGSCPQFPHGAIDPIEKLSQIAIKYKVPLHVDACLGGFLIVFMEEAGFKLPLFDFRLKGVTSISCDTHKYGYTPKGSSVIMYRNVGLRKHQYFSAVEWPGGIYVSPTFAGSRAGSLIAMTWATLVCFLVTLFHL
jgi:sphinganine-1-phosphate aldolase